MQVKALGQDGGFIAPGTRGHSINCPCVVGTEEGCDTVTKVLQWREGGGRRG